MPPFHPGKLGSVCAEGEIAREIGRLMHDTGSLPDGKLEAIKGMSERRGMPFEWSFLLDALQTERDQGITIDTTQIRFRTMSRDVVLIDTGEACTRSSSGLRLLPSSSPSTCRIRAAPAHGVVVPILHCKH